MKSLLRRPRRIAASWWAEETGAVTVDWVVLTAALVGIGLAIVTLVGTAINDPAQGIAAFLTSYEVGWEDTP
jgi:hypothetical protein